MLQSLPRIKDSRLYLDPLCEVSLKHCVLYTVHVAVEFVDIFDKHTKQEKTYIKPCCIPLYTIYRKHVVQPGNCGKMLCAGLSLNVPQEYSNQIVNISSILRQANAKICENHDATHTRIYYDYCVKRSTACDQNRHCKKTICSINTKTFFKSKTSASYAVFTPNVN